MTNILVCVTRKPEAAILADAGMELLNSEEDKLFIVNLCSYETYYMNPETRDSSLDHLYAKAVETGADFRMIRSNTILRSLYNYIIEKDINEVIIEDAGEFRVLKGLEKMLSDNGYDKVNCNFKGLS